MIDPCALLAAALDAGTASPCLTRWPDPGDVVLVGGSPEAPALAWTSARIEVDPFAHAPSDAWERHEDTDGVQHQLHGGVDTAPSYVLPVQWVVARAAGREGHIANLVDATSGPAHGGSCVTHPPSVGPGSGTTVSPPWALT